eukprot:TRINITY_DN9023_c0_g1_i2.p2 TRINITY_DN9023_c0_g1~~TRINITY_DN9023_c0_g1_i2.p2  ORF type:complete len:155 (-),score=29.36 TRINITY_DN9023_c0_g1_i2:394-858(-)
MEFLFDMDSPGVLPAELQARLTGRDFSTCFVYHLRGSLDAQLSGEPVVRVPLELVATFKCSLASGALTELTEQGGLSGDPPVLTGELELIGWDQSLREDDRRIGFERGPRVPTGLEILVDADGGYNDCIQAPIMIFTDGDWDSDFELMDLCMTL